MKIRRENKTEMFMKINKEISLSRSTKEWLDGKMFIFLDLFRILKNSQVKIEIKVSFNEENKKV